MDKNSIKGSLCVLFAGICWGFMSVLVHRLNDIDLKAMDIITLRVWVSSVAMVLLMLFKDRKAFYIKLKDIWCFVGTGIVSLTMFNYFYFSNIVITSPGVACVLMYTSPFFIMFLSAFLFKEKLTKNKLIACVIAFFGCVLACGATGGTISLKGVIFGLMSGLGYGLYSIFGRYATDKGYSSMTVSAYTFLFACLGTAPFSDYGKIASAVFKESVISVLYIVFMIILVTVVPYVLYTKGLSYIETGKAGIIAMVEVVTAFFVGFFFFSETISFAKTIGVVLVFLSLIISRKNTIYKKIITETEEYEKF